MSAATRRRAARGATLVEVMIAISILAIAAAGFAGTSNYAASATRIGHRRTSAALIRGALIDRLNVTGRTALRTIAEADEGTWIVDACFDRNGVRTSLNSAYSAGFECPDTAYYRSWIRATDDAAEADAASSWSVSVYVERIDPGCDPDHRYASVACLAADLHLTD